MPDDRREVVPAAAHPTRPPGRGSLRRTLTLAMVLMAVVPALIGALLLGFGGRTLIRAEVFRHMQSIAQGVSLDVEHLIQARRDRTDAFVHRLYVQRASQVLTSGVAASEMGPAQARSLLAEQLDTLARPSGRSEGFAVVVSLPEGRPLAWSGLSAAQAVKTAAYHKADLPQDVGKPSISPVHLATDSQVPVVCFIEAIHQSPSGSAPPAAALILSVALAPTVYATLDARTGLGETGEIVLVDHTGLALKDLRYEPGTRLRKTVRTEPIERALRGDTTVRDSLDYRGVPVVAAAAQVPTTRWGIVAKTDTAEAYAGITRLARLWGALMLGLLLVGSLSAGALSRHLLRPVAEFSVAAQALAEGSTSALLDTGRTDELGQMARDFDTMAARVASARTMLEVALAQAEETRSYLDNLLDYANAPIIVWDTDLRITRFNAAFERLTGRSEVGVLGEQVTILLPEAERERHTDAIRGATLGEHWETIEIPIQHVDGSIRTVLWNSAAVYGPDGETVVAAIAQGQDITDRKAAEAALRASEQQYRSLFVNMREGMSHCEIIRDEQGQPVDFVYLEVNPAFTPQTGYADVVGRRVTEVIPGVYESSREMFERYGRAAQTGQPDSWELHFPPSNKWFSVGVRGSGRDRFVVVFDDITDRKQAAEALVASEQQYRTLFETMTQGVVYQDAEGQITAANPAAERILGLSLSQMQGRTSVDPRWQAVTSDGLPLPGEQHPAMVALRTGEVVRDVVMGVHDPAANMLRWICISATPEIPAGATRPQRVFATFTDITERKAAEAALRTSEQQYRTLFTNMLNGLACHEIVLNEQGKPVDYRFLEVNDTFETMLGLKREQVVGRLASELFPKLQPSWVETYGQVALTGSVARFEEYAEGLDRWFEVQAYSPRRGEFVTLFDDITERKQAEEALKQAHERLQSIINSSPAAIIIQSATLGVELYSPAAERLFGWTAEEALGQTLAQYVGLRFEADSLALRQRVDAGETVMGYETQRQRRDGSLVDVSISIAPLQDDAGVQGRFVAIITDLSERRRAEREAAERGALEELLQVTERMLAATSPSGLLEQLVEGVRELTDSALCTAAYGYDDGRFTADVVTRTDELDLTPAAAALRAVRDAARLKLLETKLPVRLTEVELASLSNFALPAPDLPIRGFIGTPLVDASRETVGMIMASNKADGSALSARDEALLFQLTALASLALRHLDLNLALSRQAADLESANRELAAFSHSVSHDLRAPLRAVDGFSQALIEDYGSKLDAPGLDYLNRLRTASQRMGDLIDDLLLLSRVTRETMHWDEVDLSALAQEIAAELDESDPSRSVVWTIQPGLKITGHARLLGVLLRNLLGNAFKFTGKTPEATIEFGVEPGDGDRVYFVKDNGAGFDMAYAVNLFAPFQRLHSLEEFPGNGVGLAIVQRVVNRHGGKVWAEAEIGKGATVRFAY